MTPEQAAALRAPFPAEMVDKLPRVWCRPCRDAPGKHCDKHPMVRCDGCRSRISDAHLHLDYVGHAAVTDRLLHVDPEWTWQPVAVDPAGLPALDGNGGLWITLTVAGVSRPGYGHADGKSGGDAVKERIGDAIRNAAMRFGVGLDLWMRDHGPTPPTADRPADDSPRPDPPAEARRARDPWAETVEMAGALGVDEAALAADVAARWGAPFAGLATEAQRAVWQHWRDRVRDELPEAVS